MFGKNIDGPAIEGTSLTFRPFGKADLPRLAGWVNDPVVSKYLGNQAGYTIEQEEKWYETMMETDLKCSWGIFWGDRLIGNAGFHGISHADHSAEYGIVIGDKDCWGKGIGTATAKAIVGYGFQSLNFDHIFASVFLPNEGSRLALERAGFTEYGRKPGAKFIDGQYRIEWMSYLSREAWASR